MHNNVFVLDYESKDNSPIGFIKFGKSRNIEKLRKGHIYMKPAKYYKELEIITKNKGMGDRNEFTMPINAVNITIEPKDGNVVKGIGKVELEDKKESKSPIYCLFSINKDNLNVISQKGNMTKAKLIFSQEQKCKLKEFGDSALIINASKFISKVTCRFDDKNKRTKRKQTELYHCLVKYDDLQKNSLNRMCNCQKNFKNVGLYKDIFFEYQNEYRFILDKPAKNFFKINIGNIKKISYLLSIDELLKGNFEIEIKGL